MGPAISSLQILASSPPPVPRAASFAPHLAFLPGHWEIVVILLIVLLLFGSRLPGMARNLGSSFTEFKKGVKGESEGETKAVSGEQAPHQVGSDAGEKQS